MTASSGEATSGQTLRILEWRRSVSVGIVMGLFLAGAVFASTAGGLAMGQRDAPTYLSSAESLQADLGYRTEFGDPGKPIDFEEATSPVVDFPPGYPTVLSLGVMAGLDSETSARLLGALMVFAITVAVFVSARKAQLSRSGAALVALIAAALTLPYTNTAASEPLYGLLLIITLTAMGVYVRTRGPVALIVATLLATTAITVRSGGLALLGAVVILTWLSLRGWRRWIISIAVLVVGLSPFLLLTGFGRRVLGWHPPELGSFKILANAVAEWFVPPVGTPTLRVAVFLALVAGLLAWARPWSHRQDDHADEASSLPSWSAGLVVAAAQLALLIASKTFLSFQLSFGSRQLYPVGLGLLFAAINYRGHRSVEGDRRVAHGFLVLGLSCLLATGWAAVGSMSAVAAGERAFNSNGFLSSDAVEFVVGSVPGEIVYSNIPDGLWVAGLPNARPLPTLYDPLSLSDNDLKDEEMSRLAELVVDGAVIFYYLDHERRYMVPESELRAIAPCVVVADGTAIVLAGPEHSECSGV